MNKKHLVVLFGLAAALSLTACSSDTKTTETEAKTEAAAVEAVEEETDAAQAEAVEEETDAEEELALEADGDDAEEDAELALEADEEVIDDEEETEAELEPITPSDYLVANASQYVTLGDLEGIEVTKYVYEITDDMVQEYVQYDLDMYSEEIDVDRASQTDDIVYVDLTSSIQGSDEEAYTESTYFTLGYEEYGAEFDENLTGVKPGDQVTFTITFDDTIWIEEWIDQTVDFTADITAVSEINVPEYNEEFVQEYTDYDTIEEYEESLRASLESEYEDISYSDVIDALFETAVANSEFSSYPQELYDSCKAEILSFYAAFAGTDDEEEIFELFGMTEDDIKADVEYYVYRRLLVSALCEANDIEVTQEDYFTYLEDNAPYYDYDSAAEFESDYTRETLVWSLYESAAADLLYESANVTEEIYDETLYYDEEYDDESYVEGEEIEVIEDDEE